MLLSVKLASQILTPKQNALITYEIVVYMILWKSKPWTIEFHCQIKSLSNSLTATCLEISYDIKAAINNIRSYSFCDKFHTLIIVICIFVFVNVPIVWKSVYVCVFVCMCVCVRERERASKHLISMYFYFLMCISHFLIQCSLYVLSLIDLICLDECLDQDILGLSNEFHRMLMQLWFYLYICIIWLYSQTINSVLCFT